MTLYHHHPSSPPRFHDGKHHILSFWEDAMRIDTLEARLLKIDPDLSQVHAPAFTLHQLGSRFWAEAVARGRRPVTVTLEGDGLGRLEENTGYSAAADGHYERAIHFVRARSALDRDGWRLEVEVRASPVLPKDPPLEPLSDADRRPKNVQLAFQVALDMLPDLLAMTEGQRANFDVVMAPLRRAR